LRDATEAIPPKAVSLEGAEEEKRIQKAKHSSTRETLNKQLINIKSLLENLRGTSKTIATYEAKDNSSKLERLTASVQEIAQEKARLEQEKEEMNGKKARLQKDVSSQHVNLFNYFINFHQYRFF
jgi:chromosome segregation ATPase